MARSYQNAFDSLFEFSKQIAGGKLSERSFEWESGGGNHREVHMNHMITVEGAAGDRPFMLVFQSDPPEGRERGLELFLSAMQVSVDLTVRPRPWFSLFTRGKIKVEAEQVKHLLFTCPKQHRGPACELARRTDLIEILSAVDWGGVRSVQFQEGSGISMCFMGEMVGAVSAEWLRANLDPLYQLLLVC